MPIYEYRCPSCGEKFEKLVRFGSNDLVHCPRCDSDTPVRTLSLFAHTSGGGSATAGVSQSSCTTST